MSSSLRGNRQTVEVQKAGQVIWLVGASTGIGKDLALRYALENASNHIVISARTAAKLESLRADIECAGAGCSVIELDVTNSASLSQAQSRLDVLFPANSSFGINKVVFNAGTCEYMDSNDIDVAMARRVFDTNYFGALEVSRIALPFVRLAASKKQPASLVFVSSSVTYQALPRAHAYGASKSALRYFAECLLADLQKEKIAVQLVSPGFVETPMTAANDFDMPFIVSSEDAAKRMYKGIERGDFDTAFPLRFTSILKFISYLPAKLRFKVLGKMSRHDTSPSDNPPLEDTGSSQS